MIEDWVCWMSIPGLVLWLFKAQNWKTCEGSCFECNNNAKSFVVSL